MRKLIAIITSKLLRIIGKLLKKGSSLPGGIALKIDPHILDKIKMPEYIIAVTGSNGKTSTVEMIANILRDAGKKFAYNKEGSNQIEGVTTFILSDCTLTGRVKSDILLIESDERFARHTFKHFSPTHYVITNLYRDQLTRNGHPEWIYDIIKESIPKDTTLILNADDPLVSCFASGHQNVIWFGANKLPESSETSESIYNDFSYCPHCNAPMEYEYYHYNHIGNYHCTSCEFIRNDTSFTVVDSNLPEGSITVKNGDNQTNISLFFPSVYHIYNTLAAFSVAKILGVSDDTIAESLNHYSSKTGRIQSFQLGSHTGILLTSKHENSISYDQSLRIVSQSEDDCIVVIIVDAISRKYFTSETSWLWDIDFELLSSSNVKKIFLAGLYCNDLATRFEYSSTNFDNIEVVQNISDLMDKLNQEPTNKIYTITCFSDKDKFLSHVDNQQNYKQQENA